jgi:hypothetical protein
VKVLTAGHCLALTAGGSPWIVNYNPPRARGNGAQVGSASGASYRYGHGHDTAWLTPTATPAPDVYIGGVSSRSAAWIVGAQRPHVGWSDVCISGGYRGESCGWTIDSFDRDTRELDGTDLGPQWFLRRPRVGRRCPFDDGDSGSPVYRRFRGEAAALGIASAGTVDGAYCWATFVALSEVRRTWGGALMVRR